MFGLSTSPRLWFEKLAGDLKKLKVQIGQDTVTVAESPIDPCAFTLVKNGTETCGVLEAHVDDLILWAEVELQDEIEAALSSMFPISDWERTCFAYVGNEYIMTTHGCLINQREYTESRLKEVDVPKGANADEVASPELMHDNRTGVGCLSWLAKETRPDLACQANMAQVRQKCPTIGDIKATNTLSSRRRNSPTWEWRSRPSLWKGWLFWCSTTRHGAIFCCGVKSPCAGC